MHTEDDTEEMSRPPALASSALYGTAPPPWSEERLVWAFAYGANMNRASLTKRQVNPLRSLPAVLPNYVLKFNLRGGMGSVQPQEGAEVHGVVHQLTESDMRKLENIEGRGHIYSVEMHRVRTYDGQEIEASVFVGMPSLLEPGDGKPSERYRNILVQSAREYGIDAKHIAHIESFDYIRNRSPEEYLRLSCPPRTLENTYSAGWLAQRLAEDEERRRVAGIANHLTGITLLKDKIVQYRIKDDAAEMFAPYQSRFEGKDFALFYCSAINEPSLPEAHTLEELQDAHYAWVEDQMLGDARDIWLDDLQVLGYLER